MTSRYEVLFGDDQTSAGDAFYGTLTSLEVEENADLPGAIQLTLPVTTTASDDLTGVGDARFGPHARIAVVASASSGSSECIFDGYVLSHKIHLDRGTTASSLRVWGQDVSWRMNLVENVKAWSSVSDGDIATTIFGPDGGYDFITSQTVDDGLPTHDALMQRSSDARFLRELARRDGVLFRVVSGSRAGQNAGVFAKPVLTGEPSVTLTLNPAADSTVDALDFSWDVARPTEVAARQALFNDSNDYGVDGGTTESGLDLLATRSLSTFAGRAMQVQLTTTADSLGDLQQRAASLLREAGWFVRCEGEGDVARIGAVLRAARVVQVAGAGSLHSGKYLVWSVRHTITASSHRMRFVLVRNAVGSAGGGG